MERYVQAALPNQDTGSNAQLCLKERVHKGLWEFGGKGMDPAVIVCRQHLQRHNTGRNVKAESMAVCGGLVGKGWTVVYRQRCQDRTQVV